MAAPAGGGSGRGSGGREGCRARSYAEICKPRPLFRGWLHGGGGLALLAGAVAAAVAEPGLVRWGLVLGLGGKSITYLASAAFHLLPFRSLSGVTRAFVLDLLCIPFSAFGAISPFVPADSKACAVAAAFAQWDSAGVQVVIATVALLANAACVRHQTAGQIGLATRPDRSDAPRSAVVAAYSVWAIVYIWLHLPSVWRAAFLLHVALTVLALGLSGPVTAADQEEPLWARAPWHRAKVWGLHEDFHLVLAMSDGVWLWIVLEIGG